MKAREGFAKVIVQWLTVLLSATALADSAIVQVGRFSEGDLSGWEAKQFVGQTHYSLIRQSPHRVLRAEASKSASGLFRQLPVNLTQTPYLNWCWQVTQPLPPLAEKTKDGDDYAARIYLVRKGGFAFWRTKALNYVWSSAQKKGAVWPNAFAGRNVMMLAVRDPRDTGWQCEKRNVRTDWLNVFGDQTDHIDAIAIMTDSDNSKQQTAADYGDIWFSSD